MIFKAESKQFHMKKKQKLKKLEKSNDYKKVKQLESFIYDADVNRLEEMRKYISRKDEMDFYLSYTLNQTKNNIIDNVPEVSQFYSVARIPPRLIGDMKEINFVRGKRL